LACGPAKQAIVDFVARTCGEDGSTAVAPEDGLRCSTTTALVLREADAISNLPAVAGLQLMELVDSLGLRIEEIICV